jgi:hypothetical protein
MNDITFYRLTSYRKDEAEIIIRPEDDRMEADVML